MVIHSICRIGYSQYLSFGATPMRAEALPPGKWLNVIANVKQRINPSFSLSLFVCL